MNREVNKLIDSIDAAGKQALNIPGSQIDILFESLYELTIAEDISVRALLKMDAIQNVQTLKDSIRAFGNDPEHIELQSKIELKNGSIIWIKPGTEAMLELLDAMKQKIEESYGKTELDSTSVSQVEKETNNV